VTFLLPQRMRVSFLLMPMRPMQWRVYSRALMPLSRFSIPNQTTPHGNDWLAIQGEGVLRGKVGSADVAQETKYYYAGMKRIAMRQDGSLIYLFSDHLGSTSRSYDVDSGTALDVQKYMPFGVIRSGDGGNAMPTDYNFTGQRSRTDDFGLMHYGARWYDSSLGRFVQADTIIPNPGFPMAFDRFAYSKSVPFVFSGKTWVEHSGQSCTKVPLRSSTKAWRISSCVFITNGP